MKTVVERMGNLALLAYLEAVERETCFKWFVLPEPELAAIQAARDEAASEVLFRIKRGSLTFLT